MAKATRAGDTPLFQQYRRIHEEVPDALLMFRLGDFYELFWEDAKEAAALLGLQLTARDNRGERVPMCGIPHHAFTRYVRRLLEAGRKVAVAEQLEDPATAKGLVERGIVRVLTPGTVIEEELVDPGLGNFLALILPFGEKIGVAILESSGGETLLYELPSDQVEEAVELVSTSGASEILLERSLRRRREVEILRQKPGLSLEWFENLTDPKEAEDYTHRTLGLARLRGLGIAESPALILALYHLLRYLAYTFRIENPRLRIRVVPLGDHLLLSTTAVDSLELIRSVRGGREGSLLAAVDRTKTPAGRRRLAQLIVRPHRRLAPIRARQRLTLSLSRLEPKERGRLAGLLGETADVERIVNRMHFGRTTPRDLAALRDTLRRLPAIAGLIPPASGAMAERIRERLAGFEPLADYLSRAIAPEPPAKLGTGEAIAPGFSEKLDRYREVLRESDAWFRGYQERLREETGIKSLKVRHTPAFGWFIEVTNPNLHLVPDYFERRQTLKGGERFTTPELAERERDLMEAQGRVEALEEELFLQVVERVKGEGERLTELAEALAELDVALCGVELMERAWVMPKVREEPGISARDLTHPMVEASLPTGRFIPNPVELNHERAQVVILTGPNMGGKSTYLRSVALLVILAQAGLPVPAKEARVGLVDRVFTRVGAGDELIRGASTFLVEMEECAEILSAATDRSLVILDEVGRGTSTFDGVAIARAILEELATGRRRPLTIFATHYHELTELGELLPNVVNLHMACRASEEGVTFLYRVERGAVDRSYGIEVARMAGLPPKVLESARRTLAELEALREEHLMKMRRIVQLGLFEEGRDGG